MKAKYKVGMRVKNRYHWKAIPPDFLGLLRDAPDKQSGFTRGRKGNPLSRVRKVYYVICAHKGSESYYLARSGKLTREQSSAARFPTAQAAIDKAKAHLKNYAASRKYRFDLKLAY